MEISFDPAKNARNVVLRGLSFSRAADLDWSAARVHEDDRKDYGERRFIALAEPDGRLHLICFTAVGHGIRVISFRKANSREQKAYAYQKTPDR